MTMRSLIISAILLVMCFQVAGDDSPARGGAGPEVDIAQVTVKRTAATLYDRMVHMTYPERAMLLDAQPPEVWAAVWDRHLRFFTEDHPDLTPEQLAVVGNAKALLTPAWLAIKRGHPQWDRKMESVKAFETAALKQFSRELYMLAFVQLGPPYTALPGRGVPQTQPCQCSTQSDWCWPDGPCLDASSAWLCYPVLGCGTLGMYGCDGLCY